MQALAKPTADENHGTPPETRGTPAEERPEPAASASAPPAMGLGKSAIYIACSVLLFLTQGLGMNLALANLTQLQGSLSATSVEAAWLSAAYMAPNVSLSAALVKIRAQYGLRRFAEIGIVTSFMPVPLNAAASMLCTVSARVTFVRPLQPSNTCCGTAVILFPIYTSPVRPLQL